MLGRLGPALFVLAMPPVTHTVLNRVEPWVLGLPFFYAALLVVYTGLILSAQSRTRDANTR